MNFRAADLNVPAKSSSVFRLLKLAVIWWRVYLWNLSAKGNKKKRVKSVKIPENDSAEDFAPEKKKKKKKDSKLLRAKLSDSDDDDDSNKKKDRKTSKRRDKNGSDDDSDVIITCVSFLVSYSHW